MPGFLGIYDVRDNTYSELPINIRLTGRTTLVRSNKLSYFGGINVDFPGSIDQGLYVVDLDTLPVTPTRSDN